MRTFRVEISSVANLGLPATTFQRHVDTLLGHLVINSQPIRFVFKNAQQKNTNGGYWILLYHADDGSKLDALLQSFVRTDPQVRRIRCINLTKRQKLAC